MIELTRSFFRATRVDPPGLETDWLTLDGLGQVRFEYTASSDVIRRMTSCTARLRIGSGEFIATVTGMVTCCPPYSGELRGKVRARMDDGTDVIIRRNRFRPFNQFRVIDVAGPSVEWRVHGRGFDVRMVDLKSGRLLAEKKLGRNPRISSLDDGQEAALLVALARLKITQATLLRYSRLLNSI